MNINQKVSKAVGWGFRNLQWPTMLEVEEAITERDNFALLQWWRHLPSPGVGVDLLELESSEVVKARLKILKRIKVYLEDL